MAEEESQTLAMVEVSVVWFLAVDSTVLLFSESKIIAIYDEIMSQQIKRPLFLFKYRHVGDKHFVDIK